MIIALYLISTTAFAVLAILHWRALRTIASSEAAQVAAHQSVEAMAVAITSSNACLTGAMAAVETAAARTAEARKDAHRARAEATAAWSSHSEAIEAYEGALHTIINLDDLDPWDRAETIDNARSELRALEVTEGEEN